MTNSEDVRRDYSMSTPKKISSRTRQMGDVSQRTKEGRSCEIREIARNASGSTTNGGSRCNLITRTSLRSMMDGKDRSANEIQ